MWSRARWKPARTDSMISLMSSVVKRLLINQNLTTAFSRLSCLLFFSWQQIATKATSCLTKGWSSTCMAMDL